MPHLGEGNPTRLRPRSVLDALGKLGDAAAGHISAAAGRSAPGRGFIAWGRM